MRRYTIFGDKLFSFTRCFFDRNIVGAALFNINFDTLLYMTYIYLNFKRAQNT